MENNQDLCDVIEALLNEEGDMEMVGAAHDGIQALEMIERHKPDVVLLDMIMPYLDGLGVLSKLAEKESDYRPKVIVVSAFEEEEMIKMRPPAQTYLRPLTENLRAGFAR